MNSTCLNLDCRGLKLCIAAYHWDNFEQITYSFFDCFPLMGKMTLIIFTLYDSLVRINCICKMFRIQLCTNKGCVYITWYHHRFWQFMKILIVQLLVLDTQNDLDQDWVLLSFYLFIFKILSIKYFFFFLFWLYYTAQNLGSLTWDWTQILAVRVLNLNHWTTREFPKLNFCFCLTARVSGRRIWVLDLWI